MIVISKFVAGFKQHPFALNKNDEWAVDKNFGDVIVVDEALKGAESENFVHRIGVELVFVKAGWDLNTAVFNQLFNRLLRRRFPFWGTFQRVIEG